MMRFDYSHCSISPPQGLRIVTPPNGDQHVLESSRQFDEAHGLSFAQQLKNKVIPAAAHQRD
jgi:hypothetical protein